jgi:hypothetical protein
MSDTEYIKDLEKRNNELTVTLENHTLIRDILKAKVNIIDSSFFMLIHPKQLCSYMEALGWTQKYEKMHERFLTRCYLSPHKDAKCKVFIQDLYVEKGTAINTGYVRSSSSVDGMAGKAKEVVSLLARIHKKGELEVIFEILSEKTK